MNVRKGAVKVAFIGAVGLVLAALITAVATEKSLGRKQGMASDYGNLGSVYRIRGELDRAIEFYQQSLALFTAIGARPQIELVQSWVAEAEALKNAAQ